MKKSKAAIAFLMAAECAVFLWLFSALVTHAATVVIEDVQDTWIPEEQQEFCRKIGAMYGICPELLEAMIEKESSGRPDAVNGNCVGLLQIDATWNRERMERLGVDDLWDEYSNILVAADYLLELFEENEGDLYLVLMKYNMRHDKAESFVEQGIYSEYAQEVAERAAELERLHESQEGGDNGKADYD